MGTANDPTAVVDEQLRHDVEGLRVADCSIMPTVVSGNTGATALMIGTKGANMILGRSPPSLNLSRTRLKLQSGLKPHQTLAHFFELTIMTDVTTVKTSGRRIVSYCTRPANCRLLANAPRAPINI